MRLIIRHNMEIAHRLSLSPGKCQQIHGHGMQITLTLTDLGQQVDGMCVNRYGSRLEFGDMKRKFREHIDETYDHRLILNKEDPWAQPIYMLGQMSSVFAETDGEEGFVKFRERAEATLTGEQKFLPGLSLVDDDPTVENLARWIAEWAAGTFKCDVLCRIDETKTNGAEVKASYNGYGVRVVP